MNRLLLFACALALAVGASADFGSTYRVSFRNNGDLLAAGAAEIALNANGRYSAFSTTDSGVVGGDTNGVSDVFLRDNITGSVKRVSVSSSGAQGNGASYSPAVSSGARHIVFVSVANNLVEDDENGFADIFMHDTETGTTKRVGLFHRGGEPNGPSFDPQVSGNGRVVVFRSEASNFALDDDNESSDIFYWDTRTGLVRLVSRSRFSQAVGNGPSSSPRVDLSGSIIAFSSVATNFEAIDNNGAEDVFVILNGAVGRISRNNYHYEGNGPSFEPYISPDGKHCAYATRATNLYPGDANGVSDLILFDLTVFTSQRINITPKRIEPNGDSYAPRLDWSAGLVAFGSDASNLTADDNNAVSDVFVRDRAANRTLLASKSSAGQRSTVTASSFSFSSSGSVAFLSADPSLVPGDTNGVSDAFVHDLFNVRASGVEVERGVIQAGSLLSTIYRGDGDAIVVSRGFHFGTDEPVVVIADSRISRDSVTATTLKVYVRASIDEIVQTIEFFDFDANEFVIANVEHLETEYIQITKSFGHVDANKFVSPEGLVRTRISYKCLGTNPVLPWNVSIDQLGWEIHE